MKNGNSNLLWGIGVEHEFHLFFSKDKSKPYLIDYVVEMDKHVKNLLRSRRLSTIERNFLKKIVWELSGRQCLNKNGRYVWIQKRIPTLMMEIISTNPFNNTIENIDKEIKSKEKTFISILKKDPVLRKYMSKYGDLTVYPTGMISNVKMLNKKELYTDYTGSYHLTITLPHKKTISATKFIDMHKNFGNQLQWLQPLFLATLFSGDQQSIVDDEKSEGSFRVIQVGWGNFASSDLRKISKTTGISRLGNRYPTWREKLNNNDSVFKKCDIEKLKKKEKYAKSVFGSDFRTFGEIDLYSNKKERENASGMKAPYGLEVRIFDNFDSKHLLCLLRIISLIAENSRVTKTLKYVYDDPIWNKTIVSVAKEGWNTLVDVKYIKLLEKHLGLRLQTNFKRADLVFQNVIDKLFLKNNKGKYNLLFSKTYKEPPKIPNINRLSMMIGYRRFLHSDLKQFLTKDEYTKKEFKEILNKNFDRSISNNLNDVLYALKDLEKVKLIKKNGKIIKIKIMKKSFLDQLKKIDFVLS